MISYCPKCGKPVSEGNAFCPNCGAPLQAAQPVQPTPQPQPAPQYNNRFMNQPQENQGPKPDNHLVLSIITAIMCCMPLGIWAIVLASKVDGLWNSGQYAQARENADKAKRVSIIGMVLGGLYVVIVLIYYMVILGASLADF